MTSLKMYYVATAILLLWHMSCALVCDPVVEEMNTGNNTHPNTSSHPSIGTGADVARLKIISSCPDTCTCDIQDVYILGQFRTTLTVKDCRRDPSEKLYKLFILTYLDFCSLRVINSQLSKLSCKAMDTVSYARVLDLSNNKLTDVYCPDWSTDVHLFNLSHNNLERGPHVDSWRPFTIKSYKPKMLDLSYNKLQAMFCGIVHEEWSELIFLDLSHNHIQSAECAANMSSLYKDLLNLNLNHNNLKHFPCKLAGLSNLRHLNLSYNYIEVVPCNLPNRLGLQSLDLSHNNLKAIQCQFSGLSMLISLNLSDNFMEDLLCSSSSLINLQDLDLSNNYLQTSSIDMGSLSALQTLSLKNNSLTEVSCHLLHVPKLTWLDLGHNELQNMKCNLSQLTELRILYLNHNKFDSMPCNVTSLIALSVLDLSHNELQTVSCELSGMDALRTMYLMFNNLTCFPCSLILLCLDNLDLSHNLMNRVPCDLSAMYVSGKLDLSHNRFNGFPCNLSIPNMYQLDLSYNNIDAVPCDLSKVKTLNSLYLNHNKFDSFPCNLSTLPWMQILELNHNYIPSVPKCLKDFPVLGEVDLDSNRVHVLENGSLYDLSHLYWISLKNNKMTEIQADVFMQPKRLKNLYSISLSDNNLYTLDSWPLTLVFSRNILLEIVSSGISEFTNNANITITSCFGFVKSRFYMQINNIRHFSDLFNGWNLKVTDIEEMYYCMQVLDFAYNPLVCDCVDYAMYASVHGKFEQETKNIYCQEPAHLKGKNPAFLPLDSFVCNVSKHCPIGCNCQDIPHYRNISVSCNRYNESELPNMLPELPKGTYSYYLKWKRTVLEKLAHRDYLGQAAEAIFSYNKMDYIEINALLALRNATKLYLDHNMLKTLPENMTSVIFRPDVELRFGSNPWVCDCKAVGTKKWFITYMRNIQDVKDITCYSPPNTRGKQMIYIDDSVMCAKDVFQHTPVIAILGGVIFFLVVCMPLICVIRFTRAVRGHERKEWEPMEWDEENDDGKEFDVFVSYANDDEDYIGGYLIPELEKRGFKVCFHRVHFLAGKSIIDNICESIAKSKKMLAFYSMNYSTSDFGMYEYTLAMQLDVQNGSNRLTTIKDTNLDVENLQISHSTYLRTHSYVIKDEPNFWRNLLYTLPKHKLGEVVIEEDE